jgi:hypothetical protein
MRREKFSMSAATTSDTETDTAGAAKIYVPLLDEGLDVWRPVRARRLSRDTYLILDQPYDRAVETWQFEPGTVVRCRRERREGAPILVASEAVRAPAPSRAPAR